MTQLKRALGPFSTAFLVSGNMIGIGIFVTAGRIYSLLPNPSYIILAWVVGGFLSLAGGLAYAELATRFPRAGGGYVFLREAFGPFWGFLSGFSASMVTIPGTVAFLAMGFTRYAGISDPFLAKVIGVLLIAIVSYVNFKGVLRGAILQDAFLVLKILLIFILVVLGFATQNGSFSHFEISSPLVHSFWVALPLALVPIMYTYSGWDAAIYVAGEIKEPRKNIPKAVFLGVSMVILVYLALACLYIFAIPVTGLGSKAVIVTTASSVLFGSAIGKIIGSCVAISVLGALTGTVLTGPRVTYAMSQDGLLPSFAKKVHPVYFTPSNAIIFHGCWASLLLLTGTFDSLLDYVTVPSVFFAAINVIGLFVLRKKNKKDDGATPYLTFGYPILPALFVFIMMGVVINTIVKDPLNSIWGLVIVSIGIPIYFFWTRFFQKN